jgi:L-lactate dehydrogenase complex protein LldF
VTPLLTGLENASPLPYASSLCGKCKDVCPVDIDLPRMLLGLRRDLIEQGHGTLLWTLGIRGWAVASQSPQLFKLGSRAVRWASRLAPRHLPGPASGWTRYRDLPPTAAKSFRQLWQERKESDDHEQSR